MHAHQVSTTLLWIPDNTKSLVLVLKHLSAGISKKILKLNTDKASSRCLTVSPQSNKIPPHTSMRCHIISMITKPTLLVKTSCHTPVYLNADWLLPLHAPPLNKNILETNPVTIYICLYLIGWTLPRRQSQVRLSTAKETNAAIKSWWVLLGYLLLHLWFYGWRGALRKLVWKCFVGGQGIMRLGSQK